MQIPQHVAALHVTRSCATLSHARATDGGGAHLKQAGSSPMNPQQPDAASGQQIDSSLAHTASSTPQRPPRVAPSRVKRAVVTPRVLGTMPQPENADASGTRHKATASTPSSMQRAGAIVNVLQSWQLPVTLLTIVSGLAGSERRGTPGAGGKRVAGVGGGHQRNPPPTTRHTSIFRRLLNQAHES